jgi:uncharacterized membrane protein
MEEKRRIYFLDELRASAVILMVIYHSLYNLAEIFSVEIPGWTAGNPMKWLQLLIAFLFVTISGIVSRFSRNNIKRGCVCFLCGMVITLFTLLFMPSQKILFGILHFLGTAMVIYGICEPFFDKINCYLGIAFSVLGFIFTYGISDQYLGIPGVFSLNIPMSARQFSFLFPIGILPYEFYSADYYAVFPWIFLFLAGTYIGKIFREKGAPKWMYRKRLGALVWIGQHSLLIYMVHQPVIYGLMYLCFRVF